MLANVAYQGITIAKGATVRTDGDGVFVECDAPMPVGSAIEVQIESGAARAGRVARVVEAAQGAGMAIEWTSAAPEAAPVAAVPNGVNDSPSSGSVGGGRRKRRR
jgi:hypothetical protein